MTSPSFSEKADSGDLSVPAASEQPPSKSAYLNVISPLTNAWNRYSEWRTGFGLPSPGQVEHLQKEVKCELLCVCIFMRRDSYIVQRSDTRNKLPF